MPTRRQYALLAVARRKLELTDPMWRAILAKVGGVSSATELDREGFDAVMGCLEWLGFAPAEAKGPTYGDRPGFATTGQVQLIRVLWLEWSGTPGDDRSSGLATWLGRTFGAGDMRFLTRRQGQQAIAALKAMKARDRAA